MASLPAPPIQAGFSFMPSTPADTGLSQQGPITGYDGMGMPIYGPMPALQNETAIGASLAPYPIDPTTGKPILPPMSGQTPFDPNMVMTQGPQSLGSPPTGYDTTGMGMSPIGPASTTPGFAFAAPTPSGTPSAPQGPVVGYDGMGKPIYGPAPIAPPGAPPTAPTGQPGVPGTVGAPLTPQEQQAAALAGLAGTANPMQSQAAAMAAQAAQANPYQTQAAAMAAQAGQINPFEQQAAQFMTAGAPINPLEQQAAGGLNQFLAGPIGQDPATLAAQQAFKMFQEPEIMQQLAMAGLGNSGAVGESIARGEAAALVPFMTADMQNRLNATGQLANIGGNVAGRSLQAGGQLSNLGLGLGSQQLGAANTVGNIGSNISGQGLQGAGLIGNLGTNIAGQGLQGAGLLANIGGSSANRQLQALQMQEQAAMDQAAIGNMLYNQQQQNLQTAMQAAQIPQNLANQQAQAAYNDYLRQMALSEAATLGPLGQTILPSLLRGGTTSTSGGGLFGS